MSKVSFRFAARIIVLILVILQFSVPPAKADINRITSVTEFERDKACGPRCLSAIMTMTRMKKSESSVGTIYKMIGRPVFSATTLGDLQRVAEELGFSAKGFKFEMDDLRKLKGYAILPVGKATGDASDPLHFILVAKVEGQYAIVVNTKSLDHMAVPVDELEAAWRGHALVISAGEAMQPLLKKPIAFQEVLTKTTPQKYDGLWDFGRVESGSVVEHTFRIPKSELGTRAVRILRKNCSCLSAELGRDTEGGVTLTLKLHVDKPAWQEAYAFVAFEPGEEIKSYAVKAYGNSSHRITPKEGYIAATMDMTAGYPVRLDYYTDNTDVIQYDNMVTTVPGLTVGEVVAEKEDHGETRRFSLKIPLHYQREKGGDNHAPVRGEVMFSIETTKGKRSIPMKLTVEGMPRRISASPQNLFLLVKRSASVAVSKTLSLRFWQENAESSKVKVRLEDDLPLRLAVREAGDRVMVDVTTDTEKLSTWSPGTYKTTLTITSKHTGDGSALVVPLILVITE